MLSGKEEKRKKKLESVIQACNTIFLCCIACIEIPFNQNFLCSQQAHHTGNVQYVFPTLSVIAVKLTKQTIPCVFLVICNNWILLSIHLKREKFSKNWQELTSAVMFNKCLY